jgi:hypothetical protein
MRRPSIIGSAADRLRIDAIVSAAVGADEMGGARKWRGGMGSAGIEGRACVAIAQCSKQM